MNTNLGKSPVIKSKSPNQQRNQGGVRINFGQRHVSTNQQNQGRGVRDSSVVDESEAKVVPRSIPRVEVASKFNSNVSGQSPLNNFRRIGTLDET